MLTYYITRTYFDLPNTYSVSYNDPEYRDLLSIEPDSLEELQELLTEYPDISHVSVPHSYYGYGAPLAYLANSEHLAEHYDDVATTVTDLQHIVSRDTILDGTHDVVNFFDPDFWECTISIDQEATDRLEDEVKLELIYDTFPEYDRDKLDEWLDRYREMWDDGQTVFIDSDGYTPYMSKEDEQVLGLMLRTAI